ncbi:MAG: ABC transporter substrate-binding protein [Blautia sp.]|nr:ABC transporter substrate-binding protein [Blautia sp.]
MKLKRTAMLTMAAAMTTGMLTAVPAAAEDLYEVVIQFPTLGTTPADLQMVEDKLNERTESEIGVHVTFSPVSAFETNNITSLAVSSGEKLDLAISIFEGGVANYVNKGMLLELDDLVAEYGQDILEAEGPAMAGGYFDGVLYGIPTEEKMGRVKAFEARADLLEKYGIEVDPEHVYTPEELTEIFKVVQEGEQAENPAFHCIAANGNEDPLYSYFDHTDQLGTSYASGVLMNYGVENTDIVNYFETEEFESFCSTARTWFEEGYLSADCNTVTDSALVQFQTGNFFGQFSNAEPDMIAGHSASMQSYVGTDVVPLYTSAPSSMTQNYQVTEWMIPITCDNPEKTMEFLNLTYKDKDIVNLIYRGIEGVHWNFAEGSDCLVEFPEGIDQSNTPYVAILNVWGDKMKDYVMAPNDETYYEKMKAFNDGIELKSLTLGYCFNSEPVRTQYAAVNDVITQYKAILGMGVVDPASEMENFRSALEAAGINDCIEENKAQLAKWQAAQE